MPLWKKVIGGRGRMFDFILVFTLSDQIQFNRVCFLFVYFLHPKDLTFKNSSVHLVIRALWWP